jgi:hypothetical protein
MIKILAAVVPILIQLGTGHYKVQNMLFAPVKVEITCGGGVWEYAPSTIEVPARSEQEFSAETPSGTVMTNCKITHWSKK